MDNARTDFAKFTKEDIEQMAKAFAKMRLIGSLYIGKIHEPEVRWTSDGGLEVFTRHEPGEFPALPRSERLSNRS